MGLLGLELPGDRLDLLIRYLAEIELYNETYGLVNAAGEELVVKHLLDSLAPLALLRALAPGAVADVGSGAGLPGIPLAIMMPDRPFSLIERSGKRVRFLEGAVAMLGLKNVEVLPLDTARAPAGAYSIVVFRAFTELDPQSYKILYRLLAPGGAIAAYKGRLAKVEEELARIPEAGAETIPIAVPYLDEERHLVVIRRR
jgi:16S rRNA (guanine527-N7)-methyltransferase